MKVGEITQVGGMPRLSTLISELARGLDLIANSSEHNNLVGWIRPYRLRHADCVVEGVVGSVKGPAGWNHPQ